MVEEEKFFAWLDGELSPEEAATVEAKVAADPALSRRAEKHRAMASGLKSAFGTVSASPVPERIAHAVRVTEDNLVDFSARRVKWPSRLPGGARQWAAIAASLALGIALGALLSGGGTSGPAELRGASLYAASAVGGALETQLASAASGDVRIGLTFRDRAGATCRTFDTHAFSGLACRDDSGWKLRGLFAAPEGQGANYRMAAGADPRLMDMVEGSIDGEPFDVAQEKAARNRNWQ